MMRDIIYRQEAMRFTLAVPARGICKRERNAAMKAIQEYALYLAALPSAQPKRKKGEWEEIEVIADAYDISGVKTWASKMKCDQCGFTTIAVEGRFSQYNYCPNCGAQMGDEEVQE